MTESKKKKEEKWEIKMEMIGLHIPLDDLRKELLNAPAEIRLSPIYNYYSGFADCRFLHEELGGV